MRYLLNYIILLALSFPIHNAKTQDNHLALPSEIELKGNIRREEFKTELGLVQMRGPRTVERDFGRTPSRAVQESMRATARVLKRASVPLRLRDLNVKWNFIFLDENLPETQIPNYLINNCHPGWMTPPANIYIVGKRVAKGCEKSSSSNTSVADERLIEILLHEIGHVVEYYLLPIENRPLVNQHRRTQSEGFASWYEILASKETSLLKHERQVKKKIDFVKMRYDNEFVFMYGDAVDYSRASLYFLALERRLGTQSIFEVYDVMYKEKVDMFTAIHKRYNWKKDRLEAEVKKLVYE